MTNKKGSKKQYNKEKILKLLNDNREGLTFKSMDKILVIGKTTHIYLARLLDDGLVEWFNQKGNKYKTYRLTDKYFEPERQKEDLERFELIKGLIKRGVMTYDKNKMTPDELEKLEGVI
ncbi:hypothetical protein ES708_04061 [subsurface metagenome]